MSAEETLEQNEQHLMSIPGVEGVGIGGSTERPEIIVMVREQRTAMANKLPKELNGYPVRVEVSGEISAL